MFAVDDGIWHNNYDAADVFFILAVVLAVITAVLYAVARAPRRDTDPDHARARSETVGWAPVTAWLSVASLALGLALL